MTHVNPFTRIGRVLHYHGEPVYLAGKYPTASVPLDGLPDIDYEPVMRELAAQRNNFFRHWLFPYWLYPNPGNAYSPFRRPNGRWDLRPPYNADYFRRLDKLLRAALHHGIVVQVTLFDAPGLKGIRDIKLPDGTLHTRWEFSPWNDATNAPQDFIRDDVGGLDEFFDLAGIPGLAQAQKAFVDEVVGRTMGYWNVCYELMNECVGGAQPDREKRVRWMDTVTGWIDAKTGGSRLVFHSDYGEGANQSGADVSHWGQNRGRFPNYEKLDGIIFHNNPRTVDPDDPRYACFRGQKVFQVSTDAFDGVKREEFAWNRDTTRQVFARKMMYQAEASSANAARGIGQAAPSPTDLRLAPFTHLYRKTTTQGPQFDLRFFVDGGQGFFIGYRNAAPYGELTRGRVEDFRFEGETQSVRLYDRLVDQTHWWRYTFSGETLTLENEDSGFRQTFQRLRRRAPVEAFVPFLYNWERVAANGGPAQHFSMRFDIDGALRTYRLNPYRQIDHHDVLAVSPADAASGTITLYRFLNAFTATWRYTFETAQRLRLTTLDGAVYQVFEARPWYVPDSAVTAPAAAAESPLEAELAAV
ncbi:MAG TPA: hypothetical protein VFR37_20335 [Longimicrobium sp.]|nr:hypothetical protein [Longimicrobium sp.]